MNVFECFSPVTKETTAGGGALPILDQAQHYGDRKVCIVLQTDAVGKYLIYNGNPRIYIEL
jgi:hypothetical protein